MSVSKQQIRSDRPLLEIVSSIRAWPFWTTLAWMDIRGRYRRTLLGPFWTAINSFVFIAVLSVVYSKLWKIELSEFLPFVASGYFVWIFFTTCVGESCQALYANGEALKSTIVTPMSMIFRVIARNFIVFLHNLVIYAAVLLYFGKPVGLSVALMLPGMLVLGIACAGAGTCLGFLCARFRDVEQMVASSLMILFFITPILWKPQLLPADSRILADGNFVYHLISLAREPLLGNVPSILSVQVSLVVAVLAVLAGLLAYAKFRGRLAYWL